MSRRIVDTVMESVGKEIEVMFKKEKPQILTTRTADSQPS
jgi:hypothetical protein